MKGGQRPTIFPSSLNSTQSVAGGVTALVKAKSNMDKIHAAADDLRNGARELNKCLRNIMAPPT